MYFAFCEERSFSGSIESCFAPKNFGKTTVFAIQAMFFVKKIGLLCVVSEKILIFASR